MWWWHGEGFLPEIAVGYEAQVCGKAIAAFSLLRHVNTHNTQPYFGWQHSEDLLAMYKYNDT